MDKVNKQAAIQIESSNEYKIIYFKFIKTI